MAGLLLDEYCAEDSQKNFWFMLTIVGLIALRAILVLIIFRKWIEEPQKSLNRIRIDKII